MRHRNKNPHDLNPPFKETAQGVACIAAVTAGAATLSGMLAGLSGEGNILEIVIVCIAAFSLTAFIAVSWHQILSFAANHTIYRTSRLVIIVILGLGLTGGMYMTSASFLAASLGGGTAVKHHRELVALELDEVASAVLERSERDSELVSIANRYATNLEGMLDCEIASGCISGSPGDGDVAGEVRRTMVIWNRNLQNVETVADRKLRLLGVAREQIEVARRANAADDESAYSAAISTAIEAISQARGLTTAGHFAAGGLIGSPIPQIRMLGENVEREARNLAMNGTSNYQSEIPVYESIDEREAVIRYKEHVPLAWTVAVAVDSGPMVMLVMLLVWSVFRRDAEDEGDSIDYSDDSPSGDAVASHSGPDHQSAILSFRRNTDRSRGLGDVDRH